LIAFPSGFSRQDGLRSRKGPRGGIRIQEPVNAHREEFNSAAAATGAAATQPPPPSPPPYGLQERAHGPQGAGDRNPSAAAAEAVAAKMKGKKVLAPSPTSSEGSRSPVSFDIASVSGAGEPSPADTLVDGGGRSNVSWKSPLVEGIMEVPKVTRHIDLKEVFDNMLLERQWADAEEMEMQQRQQQGKPLTIWPEKVHKKSLWSKFKGGMENMFSERIERQMHDSNPDSTVMVPHVNHQLPQAETSQVVQRWHNEQKLVSAIWICAHSEEFEPLVPELNEDYTLRDWCSREVIQCKVFTDHVQMTALVTALGVPLRVEYLLQGDGQDLYMGQEDSEDDTPISTCWPRRCHKQPRDHVVPRVTVLYTNTHYDIIYPHCRDVPNIGESCSQQIAQVQRRSSKKIARRESWSGENSSQHIAQGESSASIGENTNNMLCRPELTSTGAHEYDEHRSIVSEAMDRLLGIH
ncbi:hypothetical protein BAE44_0020566, partial [Dichanthelium oligosanthes]